jgi:hypothetical protein
MMDFPELPDFLRISQDARKEAWRGKKLTKPKGDFMEKKPEDPTTRAFRKALEKREAEKKAERFAYLKEMAAERKKKAIK